MIKRATSFFALSVLLAGPALACDYPTDSVGEIPRGATATAQQMEAAQQRVANYVKALEEYAACVDKQPGGLRQSMQRDRDRAIDEAQAAAEKINREIRQYNRSMQLRQAST